MFRLFLKQKLRSSRKTNSKGQRPKRNRRIYERFEIDHKHLTMMNEQDILLIKDISARGFSTKVAGRTLKRFNVGDIYLARMRYLGEIYDLEAKVTWKSTRDTVGFELINAERRTLDFMQRLLHPIELANSLRKVDVTFMNHNQEGKTWFHGDENTDLYLWHEHSGELTAWTLVTDDYFIEWQNLRGVRTGRIIKDEQAISGLLDLTLSQPMKQLDDKINTGVRQQAIDIFMAAKLDEKDTLLQTLNQ